MSHNQSSNINTQVQAGQAEEVKQNSVVNAIIWIVSLALLTVAVFANSQLPKYWVEANNVWVRVGVIVGCVVVALFLLYFSQQGKGFVELVKASRVELRRVVWPTKAETTTSSWQVVVVILITAVLLWIFDSIFNVLMKLIVG